MFVRQQLISAFRGKIHLILYATQIAIRTMPFKLRMKMNCGRAHTAIKIDLKIRTQTVPDQCRGFPYLQRAAQALTACTCILLTCSVQVFSCWMLKILSSIRSATLFPLIDVLCIPHNDKEILLSIIQDLAHDQALHHILSEDLLLLGYFFVFSIFQTFIVSYFFYLVRLF